MGSASSRAYAYADRGPATHTVTYWHAAVNWAVPAPFGGSYVGSVQCDHNHADRDAAAKCQSKLARDVERDPAAFHEIADAIAHADARTAEIGHDPECARLAMNRILATIPDARDADSRALEARVLHQISTPDYECHCAEGTRTDR